MQLLTNLLLQMVSKDIRTILSKRAEYFNILLEDVSITQVGHRAHAATRARPSVIVLILA